jgi:hypothetical protein
MHVRFGRDVARSDFDGVDLVSVQTDGSTADLVVRGAIAPLLQRLADLGAVHLSTDPLVLDDVFYGAFDEADRADGADGAVRAAEADPSDPGTEQR